MWEIKIVLIRKTLFLNPDFSFYFLFLFFLLLICPFKFFFSVSFFFSNSSGTKKCFKWRMYAFAIWWELEVLDSKDFKIALLEIWLLSLYFNILETRYLLLPEKLTLLLFCCYNTHWKYLSRAPKYHFLLPLSLDVCSSLYCIPNMCDIVLLFNVSAAPLGEVLYCCTLSMSMLAA